MKNIYTKYFKWPKTLGVIIASVLYLIPNNSYAAEYKLGADDKVRIMVFEWRPSRGEPYEWAPLNAEFTVSSNQMLSLPLVGDIAVANLTPQQVGTKISELMQQKMGLVSQPTASVEIVRYRPFYITGYIANSGEFPFRPGLTVAKAFAIAGGIYRAVSGSAAGFLKDATIARGELRVIINEQEGLLAKKARLEAEVNDNTKVDFPADLSQKDNSPSVVSSIKQEKMIFNYRRSSLISQISSLSQQKNMLSAEISALNSKDLSINKQLDLANSERKNVQSLVDRGLTITTRQLAVEQAVAQLESSKLDIQVARFKAEQDRTKIDRDISALQDQRRSELLLELRQVESRLSEIKERISTTQRLAYQAEEMSSQETFDLGRTTDLSPSFLITRLTDKGPEDIPADRSTIVEPGDVINVIRPNLRKTPEAVIR